MNGSTYRVYGGAANGGGPSGVGLCVKLAVDVDVDVGVEDGVGVVVADAVALEVTDGEWVALKVGVELGVSGGVAVAVVVGGVMGTVLVAVAGVFCVWTVRVSTPQPARTAATMTAHFRITVLSNISRLLLSW